MYRQVFILLLSLFITNCASCQDDVRQPTPVVKDSDFCEPAEINLKKLGCEEGNPTKKGLTFTEFCLKTQNGGGIYLNPKCLSTITSCSKVDECTGSK